MIGNVLIKLQSSITLWVGVILENSRKGALRSYLCKGNFVVISFEVFQRNWILHFLSDYVYI